MSEGGLQLCRLSRAFTRCPFERVSLSWPRLILLLLCCPSAGTSISIGGSSAVTATGSAAAHTTINFTNATLVAGGEADAEYLLSAQTDSGSFVLAALSAGQPNVPLQLVAALRAGKIVLSVAAVGEAAEGASVSVTGYTSAAAAAARPATAAAAAATPATPKRKSEETPTKQQPSKKQKVESEDEEDDEEEEEAPKAKAKPSKPAIVTLKNGLKMQDTKIGTGKEVRDRASDSTQACVRECRGTGVGRLWRSRFLFR